MHLLFLRLSYHPALPCSPSQNVFNLYVSSPTFLSYTSLLPFPPLSLIFLSSHISLLHCWVFVSLITLSFFCTFLALCSVPFVSVFLLIISYHFYGFVSIILLFSSLFIPLLSSHLTTFNPRTCIFTPFSRITFYTSTFSYSFYVLLPSIILLPFRTILFQISFYFLRCEFIN